MKAEQAKKPARRGVLFCIIAAAAAIIALVLAVLVLRGRNDTDREVSQPQSAMDEYMRQGLSEDLSQAIAAYSKSKADAYQSAEEITQTLTEQLPPGNWSYITDEANSGEQPSYTLYCGGQAVGSIALQSTEAGLTDGAGDSWKVSEAAFDFDCLCSSLSIVAPYGCTVYVNGVELSDDHIQETVGLYPQLLDYEMEIPEPNQLMVYALDGLIVDAAVEFDDGYTLLKDEETGVYYALPACSAALADELIALCGDFIDGYVDFTLNKVSLWGVQQYAVEDGTLYDSLTQASLGLDWGHGIRAKIEKLEIKQFTYYGNAVTCETVYKMSTKTGQRTDAARLLLVNTEDGWLVAAIEEMS